MLRVAAAMADKLSAPVPLDGLEEMICHVPTDCSPEVRSFLARIAEVKADQDARLLNVSDHLVEAAVVARGCRPRHAAIEVEGNPVGAEKLCQRRQHGIAIDLCKALRNADRRAVDRTLDRDGAAQE